MAFTFLGSVIGLPETRYKTKLLIYHMKISNNCYLYADLWRVD